MNPSRAVEALSDITNRHVDDIENHIDDEVLDTDEENDSNCPIYDSFYNDGGSQSIKAMCNFDSTQFFELWIMIEDYVSKNWNVGRGKRTQYKAQDVLFMTLTVLKHGQQWNFTARLFSIKCSTFERLITGFLRMISETLFNLCVARVEEKWTMAKCRQEERAFSNFHYARYAVDVTFQQSNRPSGNISEGKRYFSGKHKLYGYKVEVSVLPTGLAIGCTEHYPGSVSDLEIFRRNRPFHEEASKKGARDLRFTDEGRLSEFFG